MPELIIKKLETNIQELVHSFEEDLKAFRTARPSPALIENIIVEAYGSASPLKHLASISIQPPNALVVEPWDKTIIPAIIKALGSSPLGVNPQSDGISVKIYLPPLTHERKQELIKFLSSKKEEYRIKVRQIREDSLEMVKNAFDKKEISEDDKFRLKEEIQKRIDSSNKNLDEIEKKKADEIMNS
ncbi:MAG: Ribosome-recycling factor [Parcubacteria group bacterium ADurb.Bin305]|jgi:ribosome recycling factor|nr:ribosome recycling factor [Candidatus Paceibacterota bacterium]MDD3434434.1 ribosome recycling factor [Candidatus Paceibacterota bacterium]OQA44270.1 MAG: Ribosome-recycling factor [Parcubacteria group bacterium ADurb.Bin305]